MIRSETTGGLCVVTLDNPATLNALSASAADELAATLRSAAEKARAIVLTGAGRAFCTGADMSAPPEPSWMDEEGRLDAGAAVLDHFNPLSDCLINLPVPVLTAVNGAAAGYGCVLALLGDIVIASERASFSQAFAKIGLVPDGGSTYILPRLLGKARATEMVLAGEPIDAARALEWGLINRVVPDAELMDAALELGRRLASGPLALGLTRRLMWQALDSDWSSQTRSEAEAQRAAGFSFDFAEGKAAFLEKRSPQFQGR